MNTTADEHLPARTPAHRRPRGEPRPFDFQHPTTLSRENMRSMQIVHESLVRGITTMLSAGLRGVVHAAIGSIEQVPYDDYAGALPNPTHLTELSLGEDVGDALLHLPLPIAFAATELLLGGTGGSEQPERALTELERGLVRSIVEQTLPAIRLAFEPVVDVLPAITGQEANPLFAQLVAPTDMVIVISFDLTIEEVSATASLCVPFAVLQPYLDALADHATGSTTSPGKLAEEQTRLLDGIGDAPVEVAARFRPITTTSREIVSLAPGDTLMLHHPQEMPLTLEVDETAVHEVQIGRLNRHYAVRIEQASGAAVARRRPVRAQIEPPR